ncbi:MAG: AAA family ATPase, partial [Actinobacteria bacterium]|nr:AAA family ATPase [Actinomycetota bacterium]
MTDNDESRPPEEAAPDDRPTEKSVPVSKLAQWLLWRGVPREDGKTTKVPYTADFDLGSHSDPSTWTTYAEAKRVLNTEGWAHGLGFVFTKSDPYCGLDFDDCFIDGKLHEYVASLIRRLDSYTEITPSGKGLHVIVKAKLPGPGKHITNAPWGGDFEIYDNHRYFTMSGAQFVGTPKAVNERQIVVDELCSELLPAKEATKSPSSSAERVRVDISDDRLLDLARKSKHGDEFSALFDRGDRSGYDSGSEADLALCTRLAFWTAGDPERIDKLFRQSALVGEKWGRDDYRDRTIEVAIDGCSTFFGQHQAEREETIERTAEGEAPDPSDNIRITPISAVTAEPVRWLWEGWWPLGAVSLMVGEPGCNKSTLCYDRAARLSQGTLSGSLFNQPSNILIASAEDAPTFTLRPRLEAAGADLDRASFLRLARGESEGDIQLPDELPQLRTSIERAKARLVIIDPLVSHLTSRVDSHRDQDIRKVLDPLSRIAI